MTKQPTNSTELVESLRQETASKILSADVARSNLISGAESLRKAFEESAENLRSDTRIEVQQTRVALSDEVKQSREDLRSEVRMAREQLTGEFQRARSGMSNLLTWGLVALIIAVLLNVGLNQLTDWTLLRPQKRALAEQREELTVQQTDWDSRNEAQETRQKDLDAQAQKLTQQEATLARITTFPGTDAGAIWVEVPDSTPPQEWKGRYVIRAKTPN